MIVPGSSNPLLLASGAGYQITNSLRFRASNSAYLTRTPASGGSQTTYTFSYWMKRGALGAQQTHFSVATNSQNYFALGFGFINNNNQLDFLYAESNVITARKQTSRVFRDPSAWYHVVAVLDTTNATAADRLRIYINGVRETSFSASTDPTQNTNQHGWNTAVANYIGVAKPTYALYHDGYLANVYFIDGQALTPASFGQTDATTGVWVPKAYSGTYGNNGFFLQFKDAASTTTIGYDTSGNSNNFTTSGISVTSGVTFDQMLDTPTNNYCVLSQINKSTSSGTVKNAGLTWNSGGGGATFYLVQSTFVLSGKCYWEYVIPTTITYHVPGIMRADQSPPSSGASYYPGGGSGPANSVGYRSTDGDIYVGGAVVVAGATPSAGDIIMFAFDAATGELWVGRNGTWLNSGDPAAGTGEVTTVSLSYSWVATLCDASTQDAEINFGQRAFSYTPPTGFKALSTANITSTAVTTSGSFTGNAAADGPFVWTNGNPATLTINGNAVTFGTHADKTAGGFKLRSSSSSYNASGSNSWTATAGKRFVQSKKPNNAQTN
jgi:hypothetical protein